MHARRLALGGLQSFNAGPVAQGGVCLSLRGNTPKETDIAPSALSVFHNGQTPHPHSKFSFIHRVAGTLCRLLPDCWGVNFVFD
jgi:hypothetical protein